MKKRIFSLAMVVAVSAGFVNVPGNAAETEEKSNIVYSQDFEDPNLEIGSLPADIQLLNKTGEESTVGVFCDDGNKVLKVGHVSGVTQLDFVLPEGIDDGVYDVEYMFKSDLHGAYVSDMMSVINSNSEYITTPGMWYTIYINGSVPIIPDNLFKYGWFPMKTRINVDNGNINWYLDGNYATTVQSLSATNSLSRIRFSCESTGKNGDPGYLGSGAMNGFQTGTGNYYIDDVKITKVENLTVTSVTVENGSEVGINLGSITAGFNYVLNSETVSVDTVQIYKNEQRLTGGYTVYSSGAALVITFDGLLDKSADYSVILDGVKPQDAQYAAGKIELVKFSTLGYTFLSDLPVNDGDAFNELDIFPEFTAPEGVTYDSVTVKKGEEVTAIKSGDALIDIGNYSVTVIGTKDGVQEERIVEFSVVKYDGTVFYEGFDSYNEGERTSIQLGTEYCDQNVVVKDGTEKALKIESVPIGPCSSLEKLDLGGTYSTGVYEFSAKVRFIRHGFAGSDFASLYNTQNNQRIVQPHTWAGAIYHDKLKPEIGGPEIAELGGNGENSTYFTITHKIDFDNGTHELYYDDMNMAVPEEDMNTLPVDSMLFGFYVDWYNAGANGYEAERYTGEIIYVDEISVKKVGLTTIKEELSGSEGKIITNLSDAAGEKVTAKVLLREADTKSNAGEYTVIFAMYDNGKLVGVKTNTSEEISLADGYAVAEFDVPQDTTKCKISYMIFDSLETVKPLVNKKDF